MRHLLIALLACLLVPLAHAQGVDPLLQQVLGELSSHPAVRAEFTQTRTSPALDKPQISTGELLFVLGRGMLWQTLTPFQQTLVLTGARTARIDADGRTQSMRGDRGVSQVSQMLQGLLGGKLDEALRQFDVAASGTPADWTLHFTPKQARVARVLAAITLTGNDYLQGITVDMQDGTHTQIRFAATRDAGSLDALERGALGQP